jgi:hypothetical protein
MDFDRCGHAYVYKALDVSKPKPWPAVWVAWLADGQTFVRATWREAMDLATSNGEGR